MPLFRRPEIRTYIWRSAFFFCKDSIADESQLTIGEMYIRPYFYRSWRSFDERFFFRFYFAFCVCWLWSFANRALRYLISGRRKRERERFEERRKNFHTDRALFFLFFFVRIINIFVSWIVVDSNGFALFFLSLLLKFDPFRSLLLDVFILNIVVWRYKVLW